MTKATSWALRIKWTCFRLLEALSEYRVRSTSAIVPFPLSQVERDREGGDGHLWIFVSTIGELNAIEPFLRELVGKLPVPLVLLTDHPHYRDAFRTSYPSAEVCAIDHRSARVERLIEAFPPAMLVLAEIPCLPCDAPCRFPFFLAYAARRRGAAVCLINGWLYHQEPASWMDRLEKVLFERDYLRLFDLITVQSEEIRETLIAAGAPTERIFATGNIKFDALMRPLECSHGTKSPRLLESIRESARPVLTAGCVTDVSEQELVLDSFRPVAASSDNPLLVLAPRHPENAERMAILERLLGERDYRYTFRSRMEDAPLEDDVQCLVLDTLGELRDFYAVCTSSYVGLNHNVLEPLSFGKRVLVTPGWNPIHPSFPVYRLLLDRGFITEVRQEQLEHAIVQGLAERTGEAAGISHGEALATLAGATSRCLAHLEPILHAMQAGMKTGRVPVGVDRTRSKSI